MKCLVQRVSSASVKTSTLPKKEIGFGLVIYVGIGKNDTKKDLDYCVRKILNLRIFEDDNGIMNKSVVDTKGSILVISSFTLQANTLKGNRPSYINALGSDEAKILFEEFVSELEKSSLIIEKGYFKEDMIVSQACIGPVNIVIDSKEYGL